MTMLGQSVLDRTAPCRGGGLELLVCAMMMHMDDADDVVAAGGFC